MAQKSGKSINEAMCLHQNATDKIIQKNLKVIEISAKVDKTIILIAAQGKDINCLKQAVSSLLYRGQHNDK